MSSSTESFDGFWYRADVKSFGICNEDGDFVSSYTRVVWKKFAVHHETPKGVWLVEVSMSAKDPDCKRDKDVSLRIDCPTFVSGKSKRQLACPTKATALRDAIARKERHIQGCAARLQNARSDLFKLEMELGCDEPIFV